jgi:hypothetical protein
VTSFSFAVHQSFSCSFALSFSFLSFLYQVLTHSVTFLFHVIFSHYRSQPPMHSVSDIIQWASIILEATRSIVTCHYTHIPWCRSSHRPISVSDCIQRVSESSPSEWLGNSITNSQSYCMKPYLPDRITAQLIKSSVFWVVTQDFLLPTSCWFLAWFTIQPWEWRWYVLPKRGRLSTGYTALYPRRQNSL